ncbi:MAG: HU family DNA-binding protein [Anaerolineales bacterium]|jgi:DNA-binding protein HU-beta|nr:HU family DNA-binding protein [Anaerolineales bacterium]
MSERIDKDQLIARITQRTGNSAKTVEKIVDAALDELYLAFKQGESVTLRNFGSFYVRPERMSWVFKFNPAQRLRALFGWTSTYKGEL